MKKIIATAIILFTITTTPVFATETTSIVPTTAETIGETSEVMEINKEYIDKNGEVKLLPDTFSVIANGPYGYERNMTLKSVSTTNDINYAFYKSDDEQWAVIIVPEKGKWDYIIRRGKEIITIEDKINMINTSAWYKWDGSSIFND